ncbi:MAG TPA: hypothetical protein VKZ84_00945 [Bacteriovoracaceae bacterium]|nr:hypothetical protein [Bacteriovoracaceae bacterium]
MIEKEVQFISAYIDGTLSDSRKEEFENLLKSRSDLQEEILMRRAQISKITSAIPKAKISQETRESIELEIKTTLSKVITQKKLGLWEKLKDKFSSH